MEAFQDGTPSISDKFINQLNILRHVTKWMTGATSGIIFETLIIWIADIDNNRIVKWFSPTNRTVVGGSLGIEADQVNVPYGVFVYENRGMTMVWKTVILICNHIHRLLLLMPINTCLLVTPSIIVFFIGQRVQLILNQFLTILNGDHYQMN